MGGGGADVQDPCAAGRCREEKELLDPSQLDGECEGLGLPSPGTFLNIAKPEPPVNMAEFNLKFRTMAFPGL